jgi:hypothetical protein
MITNQMAPVVAMTELDYQKLFEQVERETCFRLHKPAPVMLQKTQFGDKSELAWAFEVKEGTIVQFHGSEKIEVDLGSPIIYFDVKTLSPCSTAPYRKNFGAHVTSDGLAMHPHLFIPPKGREDAFRSWVCTGSAASKMATARNQKNYIDIFRAMSGLYVRPNEDGYYLRIIKALIAPGADRLGEWEVPKADAAEVPAAVAETQKSETETDGKKTPKKAATPKKKGTKNAQGL